jgi:hypothetical protein
VRLWPFAVHASVVKRLKAQFDHARQVDCSVEFQPVRPDREIEFDRGNDRHLELPHLRTGVGEIHDLAPVCEPVTIEKGFQGGPATHFL